MRSPRPTPGSSAGYRRRLSEQLDRSETSPATSRSRHRHRPGDPVEVEGIKEAFRNAVSENRGLDLPRDKAVSIGSQTSIGHLEASAGVSGLIKAILMLRHRTCRRSSI